MRAFLLFREVLMKNCRKWMFLCVAIALAVFLILPKFGIAVAGASLIVPLLLISCCVLPMLFMMRTGQGKEGESCCSKTEHKGQQGSKGAAEKVKDSSGSCH